MIPSGDNVCWLEPDRTGLVPCPFEQGIEVINRRRDDGPKHDCRVVCHDDKLRARVKSEAPPDGFGNHNLTLGGHLRHGWLRHVVSSPQRLTGKNRSACRLRREAPLEARQSAALAQTLEFFGRAVTVITALGVAFAAVNSMHAAVTARTVETGTLRAIGFDGFPVVISVMTEALALALLGGLCGAGIAYLGFDGLTVSALNEGAALQLAFDFAVTPTRLREGLTWAVALGAVGGLFPALRSVRLPISAALRG